MISAMSVPLSLGCATVWTSVNARLITFSKPCLYFKEKDLFIMQEYIEQHLNPHPTQKNEKYILSVLLFIHVKDQYYNLGWTGVQMTFLLSKKITLTSLKWDECIYPLTRKQKALTLIKLHMIYGAFFTSPDVCVRKKNKKTDIPERHGYVAYWSLKDLTS